ncbi:blue copper protein-like [Salvia divinorum]|uniref:Blue copper protein-like n=1 Tax=Salvia divinorum TaxID=28513 RepID=A0ABD1I051_SALDI
MKMGRSIALLFVVVISPAVAQRPSPEQPMTHFVGDTDHWDTGVNYVKWAKDQIFYVGDTLVFKYNSITHSVDEVRANDYTSCNTQNVISSDQTSPTDFLLPTAGTRYFICPKSNHCSQGMKLTINVVEAPAPPSAGGNTTKKGSAATRVGGGKSFMVGLSIVVGAMLGVMN